jgi:hypothetical protein
MQRHVAAGLALVLLACCADARLNACGDKFLLIGRAIKYQKAYASAHPGWIVLYATPGSRLTSVVRQLNLQQLLTGAGHKVQVISDFSSLETAMTSAPDLIVADDDVMPQIAPAARRSGAGLLPVLDRPTRDGLAAAERTYGVVFQASARNRHPLAVIDDALKLKSKRAVTKS